MLSMHRQRHETAVIACPVIACLGALAAGAIAPAQGLLGLVRRPDGNALSAAEVIAVPVGWDVVGLEGWPAGAAVRSVTDARGEFRVGVASPCRVLVRHESGLGALGARLYPGAPCRMTATPMAEVDLPPGAARAWVRTSGSGADDGPLGCFDGARLLLPVGSYRILAESAADAEARFSEHHVRVSSSDKVQLFHRANAWTPTQVDASGVVIDGWHEVPVAIDAARTFAAWPSYRDRPGGSAQAVLLRDLLLLRAGPGGATAYGHAQLQRDLSPAGALRGNDPPLQAPEFEWRPVLAPGAAGGKVATLARHGAGLRCVAMSPIGADGATHVPRIAAGLHILLGPAIAGFDHDARAMAAPPAVDLAVRITDERGPVAGATVELSGALPHVHRRTVSDPRGIAAFARTPTSAVRIHLSTPEHRAHTFTFPAAQVQTGTLNVHAESGASLSGRVTLAGREPGHPTEVSLRDTTGVLGFTPRTLVPDTAGRFAFSGLDPEGRYTLFATALVDGVTYSAKLHGVLPGIEVVLDLQSEDVPPPRRR